VRVFSEKAPRICVLGMKKKFSDSVKMEKNAPSVLGWKKGKCISSTKGGEPLYIIMFGKNLESCTRGGAYNLGG